MTTFTLPDLGEGLKDADLVEWLVKEGQSVKLDELVLLVETAKAVVELPAPASGIITRLAVAAGETVQVGQVLFEYEESHFPSDKKKPLKNNEKLHLNEAKESVSVVGELSKAKEDKTNLYEIEAAEDNSKQTRNVDPICMNTFKESKAQPKPDVPRVNIESSKIKNSEITSPKTTSTASISPRTMAFAKKLGLDEDFEQGLSSEITLHELIKIYQGKLSKQTTKKTLPESDISLNGARKVMAQVMSKAHQEIPSATLFDDADISHWKLKTDITLKLIRAISSACLNVPLLNAWFDSESMSIHQHKSVDLGLAINSERGLFVPVLRQVNTKNENQIRTEINSYRMQINDQTIAAKDLVGATISLSNFGVLSGRYATPIIVPPQVCIVGIGKSKEEVIVRDGKIQVGRILPISLSFDHRVATGAEAALFMQNLIQSLEEK